MSDRDSVATLDLLLKSGADVNAKDLVGMTILSRTVSQTPSTVSSYSDIRDLLERGPNIHVRNYKGETLLH
jgi:ankyrin repeat protein